MQEQFQDKVKELGDELFEAKYAKSYYHQKFVNLATQVELLTSFANEPAMEKLTIWLSKNLSKSNGQLLQDLIISFLFGEKKGYFCEIGGADGKTFSNTFFLEKLGWNGVVAEPSTRWHELLYSNRSCNISIECVYHSTGKKLIFNEVDDGMYSSLLEFSESDMHASRRANGLQYDVDLISLEDLLRKYSAPRNVDFISVDTEGSELSILEGFDFKKFIFGAIFVEHNFTKNREKIWKLLTKNGYLRVLSRFSRWDDWYLSQEKYDLLKSIIGEEALY